jgi:hypothetical protein
VEKKEMVSGALTWYFLPQAVSVGQNSLVLAGAYSQGFVRDGQGRVVGLADGEIVGAIFRRGDSVPELIMSPLTGRNVGAVRAAHLGADEWAFIFAELRHPPRRVFPDEVVSIWAGRYHGGRWYEIHEVYQPRNNLVLDNASQLTLWRDTLIWVASSRSIHDSDLFVLMGRDTSWTVSTISLPYTTYVRTAASATALLVAATYMQNESSHGLVVLRKDSVWREVAQFEDSAMFTPFLHIDGDSTIAVWSRDPPMHVLHTLRAVRWRTASDTATSLLPGLRGAWRPVHRRPQILQRTPHRQLYVVNLDGRKWLVPVSDSFVGDLIVAGDTSGAYWIAGPAIAAGDVPTVSVFLVTASCLVAVPT